MAITNDAVAVQEKTVEERIFDKLEAKDAEVAKAAEPSKAEEVEEVEEKDPPKESAEQEEVEEVEAVEDTEDAEESDEPWMPSSLEELAEAMEVDQDDLKSIQISTKVDGKEGRATLSEVIKNYQLNKSLTEKSEKFAQERKAFEEKVEKREQEIQQKLEDAESVTKLLEDQLKEEIGSIDWNQLRADNPAQYAVVKQDYMEKIGEIESKKQKIVKDREAAQKESMEKYQEKMKEVVQYNNDQLLKVDPKLADDKYRAKEMQELSTYLKEYLTDEEINSVIDYRMITFMRKAKAFDEMQTKANPAKAKAKKKPKFVKPGTQKTSAAKTASAEEKQMARFKKSGSVEDAASILLKRMR